MSYFDVDYTDFAGTTFTCEFSRDGFWSKLLSIEIDGETFKNGDSEFDHLLADMEETEDSILDDAWDYNERYNFR